MQISILLMQDLVTLSHSWSLVGAYVKNKLIPWAINYLFHSLTFFLVWLRCLYLCDSASSYTTCVDNIDKTTFCILLSVRSSSFSEQTLNISGVSNVCGSLTYIHMSKWSSYTPLTPHGEPVPLTSTPPSDTPKAPYLIFTEGIKVKTKTLHLYFGWIKES